MQHLMSPDKIKEESKEQENPPEPTWRETVLTFAFCFVGLQVSYITWGVMQELIMTTKFHPTENVPDGMFPSPTFCVFSNRAVAIIVGFVICYRLHGRVSSPAAPMYMLFPCSMSNTTSSFCQYASLSYVDFPLQNLFKSTKVIPVMLMGKVLKGTTYPWVQYCEALMITLGVMIFSQGDVLEDFVFGGDSDKGEEQDSTAEETEEGTTVTPGSAMKLLGIAFLVGYVLSDSFTSQWQSKVYSDYGKIDQYHMMFGVNFWSILVTIFLLVVSGEVPIMIEFLSENPHCLIYNIVTGFTSTTGQLFIYYTIKRFGPVALTIIMTTRQMFSICISAALFGHDIPLMGVFGVFTVFCTLFYSINRQYQERKART